MLKTMRKFAKFFYVFLFMIIISFIFWGIGSVDKSDPKTFVAEIGEYKITGEDYWRAYENISRFYKEVYKDKFNEEMEKTMKLKEKVLDSMVDERILLLAAKDAGITASDDEVSEAITREPFFMKNNVFSREVYLNRLRLNRMTPEAYERLKREELILEKMRRIIWLSIDVSEMSAGQNQIQGNDQMTKMLSETMMNDMREKAVKSYIEGVKKQIKIKINTEIIS